MTTNHEQLNEIAKLLRTLNKSICCNATTGGGGGTGTFDGHIISSCLDPVHTSLCEFPTLITKLDELKTGIEGISITANAINLNADQIDLNVTDVETLLGTTNSNLASILAEVERGADCGDPQFVNVCNQINLTATNNALGNILTQVTAINASTDTIESLIAATNTALGTLSAINTVLSTIKSDTAAINTSITTTNSKLTDANTSLDNIELYTKTLDDLRATYQPVDCDGNDFGAPVDVLPVIITNPVNTAICNTTQLANEIAAAITFPTTGQYNTVTQQEFTTGTSTITANTVHSISYMVLAGTCVVSIGGSASTYATGESSEEEATSLINVAYSFTPSAGGKVRVKTTKV